MSCNHENNPILTRWEQIVAAKKREPAILAPDGSILRTFAGLEEEACRWADQIIDQPSEAICLQTGNCVAWPALLLAGWRTDHALVPMENEMPFVSRDRIEKLCGVGLRFVLSEAGVEIMRLDNPSVDVRSHLLKLTSGTTSEPRVIRFTARQLLADCDNVCDGMGLREDDLNYGVVSFAHSYGFSNLITPLLCRGVPLVAGTDIMPRALVDGLASSRATLLAGVPGIFRALAEVDGTGNSLRLCISAGSPLSREVAAKFLTNWRLKLHSLYGSSECGGICYDSSESADVPPGYVGPPLPNVEVRMEHEGPSQVEVRSQAVGEGYYPEQDAKNFQHGMFRPADLLEQETNGYVITGRISDVINVSGRKVNPAEIERILKLSPRVQEAVVLGLPVRTRGEEVTACVAGEATEEELRKLCSLNLPSWQVPRRWLFWKQIPLNARGKISRADLRALLQ